MNEVPSQYAEHVSDPYKLVSLLVEKDNEIAKLQTHLYNLNRAKFGTKSEKITSINQLGLFQGSELPEEASVEVVPPPTEVQPHTRSARVKRDLSKLPHNDILLEPENTTCSCCGKEMHKIGIDEVSLELEHQPSLLYVNRYIRPRYGCGSCKDTITQEPLPKTAKPLTRSIVGPHLLSNIIISKFVDSLPLYRQEQMFARLGFEIPRKSMCQWIAGACDEYIKPLYRALEVEILTALYLQGDETLLKVQDGEIPGKCTTGYLWGKAAPLEKLVSFTYAPSRSGEVAKEVFAGFKGTLQTDLFAGYNTVILPDEVTRIACLAHIRRKFIEVAKAHSKEANAVVQMIAKLYALEKNWQGLSPPERLVQRQKKSIPIVEQLYKYLSELSVRTLPHAPLSGAISYALKQWSSVEAIFCSGAFHLDNNMIEQQMRPIALGRKNYLFAGSHEGAHRAAMLYSLFATARLHKVNPTQWLTLVFKRMRSHPINRVCELLPHKCATLFV